MGRKELLLAEELCGGMSRFRSARWAERSPAGIAKIEACTCPARKGRTFSSRSSYSSIPFPSLPFRLRFARATLRRSACPVSPSKLLSLSLLYFWCFLPPRFRFGNSFLVVLTASISPRLSLSLSLSSSSSSGTKLCEFFSPSCMTLLSALVSIFFPLHAVWSCTP